MHTRADAVALVKRLRAAGKTIVFTNGVFDLLHVGHLRYLQQARDLGGALLVGLNSDRSVRQIKGPERPITSESERAEVLELQLCAAVRARERSRRRHGWPYFSGSLRQLTTFRRQPGTMRPL